MLERGLVKTLVLILVALTFGGCHADPEKVNDINCEGDNCYELHIYVSNQSFDLDPAPIDIDIDGVHVITGDYPVEGQHNWFVFHFSVESGEHTISADGDDADFEETFSIIGESWGIIDYWYESGDENPTPKHFSWTLSETAPMFM